jgi:hypothetical protein
MQQQSSDPAQPRAWGDTYLPDTAQLRDDQFAALSPQRPPTDDSPSPGRPPQGDGTSARPTHRDADLDPHVEVEPSLRQDTNEYAFGATTQQPAVGPGYATLPLGPGNEAMIGGASPAPRGFTGGAMGKVNAKLSPNFAEAALGDPPPWEAPLLSPGEAARLSVSPSGAQPPVADRSPEELQSPPT